MEGSIFLGDGGKKSPWEVEEGIFLGGGGKPILGGEALIVWAAGSAAQQLCSSLLVTSPGSPVMGHSPGFVGAGKGTLSLGGPRLLPLG